jgi:hypothetical protein
MKPDGTIVKTLPGVVLGDEHAVGAYLVVASEGSSKGWTIDPAGIVKVVAPAAVTFLSPGTACCWTGPLIVDSTTAINVGCTDSTCTANKVDLRTGAVRPLLTVPQAQVMGQMPPLTVLDMTVDRQTVWLSKVSYTKTQNGLLEVVGINLQSGKIQSRGQANALADAEVAITQDGKSLAGQEYAGVNGDNLAIRHLHVVSLDSKIDKDLQGSAPYVGAEDTPSVLFAPGGAAVAWWGGLDNGNRTLQVNMAPVGGAGKTFYNPVQADFSYSLSGVYWVNPAMLVVQNGVDTLTIDTTTGKPKLVSQKLSYIDGVMS